mgnify:CR=1 FL=1
MENLNNKIIKKPWGYEYSVYEDENFCIWFLHIHENESTSMHCHPNKTTKLVLLDGVAKISFLSNDKIITSLDFIKFAQARGLSSQRIIRSHLLPNILIPIITVLAIEFGTLIAFATVTESIFAWPGVGKLVIDAIVNLDRPIVVAYLLFVVTLFLVLNLIVDILYAALDPRVRLQGGRE